MLNELLGTFEVTERDQKLHELATRYHTECEAYDQTVCTGPIGQDGIMPANPHEMALINRNAHVVRKRLTEEAAREGIGREELARAISKWRGSVPNGKGEQPAANETSEGQNMSAPKQENEAACGRSDSTAKLDAEHQQIEILRADAYAAQRKAEQAWYYLACALPVGRDRERAFEVYENVRTAPRICV